MSVDFPLYDKLANMDNDIFVDNKIICRTITNLDKSHAETVYAIILHHFILTTGEIPKTPPYNSSTFPGGRGIKALWTNLAPEVQKIIVHYIHHHKMV